MQHYSGGLTTNFGERVENSFFNVNLYIGKSNMTKQEFLRLVHRFPVAAALKSDDDIEIALASEVLLLFMLKGDAFQLEPIIEQAHKQGKGLSLIHI